MTKTTKIIAIVLLLFILTTAYAFAAFLGPTAKPLPEPLNLLVTGCGLFLTGHFIRHITNK